MKNSLMSFRTEMIQNKQKQFLDKKKEVTELMNDYKFVVDTVIAGFREEVTQEVTKAAQESKPKK